MKKKIIVISVLLLITSGLFAKGIYNGNIQLTGSYNTNELQYISTTAPTLKIDTIDFGLETWHTFKLPILLEVGFMFDLDMGFGSTNLIAEEWNIGMNLYGLFGPAIAINVLNIVKFNFALGPTFDFTITTADDTSLVSYGSGFGINFQTLFFPLSPVSPIFGYKFAAAVGEMIYGADSKTAELYTEQIISLKNQVYLGISFNW